MFQTALKEYMRRKDRDLNKLIKYAVFFILYLMIREPGLIVVTYSGR